MQYRTGEEIRVGDVVRYAGAEGTVDTLILPGSEAAADWGCREETIAISMLEGPGYLLPSPHEDEDLDFVRRAGE